MYKLYDYTRVIFLFNKIIIITLNTFFVNNNIKYQNDTIIL